MAHKNHLIILIAVLVLAAGLAYWYFVLRVVPAPSPALVPPVGKLEGPTSLGAQIAEEAQNPIKGEVPTVAPQINPIEGLYKNPFE